MRNCHLLCSLFGVFAVSFACVTTANSQPQTTPQTREATQRRDASASEVVRRIYEVLPVQDAVNLPDGTPYWSWDVTYQPQYDTIRVERGQEVLMEAARVINDSSEPRPPVLARPGFTLRIEPLITPQEYARFKAENELIYKQLQDLRKQLRRQGISQKFDQFLPGNDEQRKKVEAYDKLRSSIHNLPDYYFQNISLSWSLGLASYAGLLHKPGEAPRILTRLNNKSKSWEHELAQAVKAVVQLLSRYEPEVK